MKNTVGFGSHNLVAKQKAREGGDPLKTRMNKESLRTFGSQSADSKGSPTRPFGPGGCGRMG